MLVSSGSISILTIEPGPMRAVTLPSTVVWMSASESSIENARPAAPSAKIPDSADADESMTPEAMMFAVFPASMTAPAATKMFELATALATASASATWAPPGFGMLSSERDVDALMDAVAEAVEVITIAAVLVIWAPVLIVTDDVAVAWA